MRRGKPPQQIYRPGSGPLRKSNALEEPVDSTTSSLRRDTNSDRDSVKRQKKPEQMLYVPRPVAQAREISNQDSKKTMYSHTNGNERNSDNNETRFKSRGYSERKQEHGDFHSRDWRDKSPNLNRRQSSESRGITDVPQPLNNWQRCRDTRSVEPSFGGSGGRHNYSGGSGNGPDMNVQAKPPSAPRRHSTVGVENNYKHFNIDKLDKLPPRLKKKYLEENNITIDPGPPRDDNWDGCTLTFQGHGGLKNPSFHQFGGSGGGYQGQNVGYHTLPIKSGRGRARFNHHQNKPDMGVSSTGYGGRCSTPPMSTGGSRPSSPPIGTSRQRSGNSSRPQTPTFGGWHRDESWDDVSKGGYREFGGRGVKGGGGGRPPGSAGGSRDNRYCRMRDDVRGRMTPAREISNRELSNRETSSREMLSRELSSRDISSREMSGSSLGSRSRNTPSRDLKRDRDIPNRRDIDARGNSERKRNRRNRGRRSRSRDYRDNDYEENDGDTFKDKTLQDVRVEIPEKQSTYGIKYDENTKTPTNEYYREADVQSDIEVNNLELQMSTVALADKPLASVQLVMTTTLDWSEEVELCDKLEAENYSDAMTRSSSLTSLQENSTMSLPINLTATGSTRTNKRPKRKSGKKSRNRSRNRSRPRDLSPLHAPSSSSSRRSRQNSTTSVDSREGGSGWSRRRGSRDRRDGSFWPSSGSREVSRDRDRGASVMENWREECVIKRNTVEKEKPSLDQIKNVDTNIKKAGVIVIPQHREEPIRPQLVSVNDHPRYPETRRTPAAACQKSLFDPNNPNKPIIVKSSSPRVTVPGFSDNSNAETATPPPPVYTTDQFGNIRPNWYDENSDGFKSCHYPDLLRDVKRADTELQYIINSGRLLLNWEMVDQLRQFLKEAQEYLLCKTIKFCESENVEQHFWNILYHNIIEVMRKAIKNDPENKEKYKAFLLYLIDEGTKYFERLLSLMENTYDFKLSNFLGENSASSQGLGLTTLALVSAQKLFLFLGDLSRYKEEMNESANYGKCRQWYIKSYEINPKNGKPYNQLALLAVHARRKLDAVYYYMRSLMSSNPVPSARESLISLFDENRKKYEQGEKKRREERLERRRQLLMKEKESEGTLGVVPVAAAAGTTNASSSLRKEIWIHPEGGPRVHRTTRDAIGIRDGDDEEGDEEDLAKLSSVEVNKRFVISYLHVHGKLITKIGMETFQETSMQMLREFRALLQHSPVPLPCNRFLQLLALNMFAIESTQLKDPQLQAQLGYRSELQERALVVSLQMFSLILERCVAVLRDHLARRTQEEGNSKASADDGVATPPSISTSSHPTPHSLPPDADVLLPAVKVWCDWLLGHANVWNPPPNTNDYWIGSPGDPWSRLATLMNLLEMVDKSTSNSFVTEEIEGYVPIRLPEDTLLRGFTPLSYAAARETAYASVALDLETARAALRVHRLLFFGTVYLCGVEPPVLRLEIEDGGRREYVSAVDEDPERRGRRIGDDDEDQATNCNNDVVLESISGEEDEADGDGGEELQITTSTSSEIRDLLTRKVELEKRKRSQELHMQRVKKILSQCVVSVQMEIWPKYLIPDTNCFIDHLEGLKVIAQAHCYTLMVPIIVLNELEGLSRGSRTSTTGSSTTTGGSELTPTRHRQSLDPQHVVKVAQSAKEALEFLKTRHPTVKCVTTRGAVLPPSNAFFTEDDAEWGADLRNDDKILTTCLAISTTRSRQDGHTADGNAHQQQSQPSSSSSSSTSNAEPRRLYREVVLLTEDRNLRVKAHARDVPVRELPDFMRWAGLGGPAG